MPKDYFVITSLFLLFLLASCEKREERPSDILLRYGDHELSKEEVVAQIPVWIQPGDSANLFSAIVEGWLKDQILTEFAESKLEDLSSIERRVRDYRNSLIVQEYLSRMRESKPPKIEENRIKEYYNQHQSELRLEEPLVKGIFLKISSNLRGKEEIPSLLSSDNPADIDRLEREWMDRSLEYKYFKDKWMDWGTLTSKIPYRFDDPEKFLEENRYFETEYGDCIYYLQISEFKKSGDIQPYEFASSWIRGLLTHGDLSEYEDKLVNEIISKAIKENKLELVVYDPLTRQLIEKQVSE